MSIPGKSAAALRFELDDLPPPRVHEPLVPVARGAPLEQRYALLADAARAVLRRLAVFVSEFTFEAASTVVACSGLQKSDVAPSMQVLHNSSLIEVRGEGELARYRLTRQTRAFALTQAVLEGEWDLTARQHAEYLQHLFEYAEVELDRGVASQ